MIDLDLDKLRRFMQERGITPNDLSLSLGHNKGYIGSILRGEGGMSRTAYNHLLTTYDIPPKALLKGTEPVAPAKVTESVTSDMPGVSTAVLSVVRCGEQYKLLVFGDDVFLSAVTVSADPFDINLSTALGDATGHILNYLSAKEEA